MAFTKLEDKPQPPNSAPRSAPKRPSAPRKETTLVPLDKLRDRLAETYNTLALPLSMFAPATSMALMDNSEKCADAWIELATGNPKIHKLLSSMVSGVGLGTVLAVHAPILLTAYQEMQIPRNERLNALRESMDTKAA